MKLKSKLMLFTAATALSANAAYAAINPETLAAAYQAEGYTYVEIKVGPTQTKLEAVKGNRKVEVIYDNASEDIIEQEFKRAGNYTGRTGVEITTVGRDFEDDSDDDWSDDEDDERDDGDDDEDDDRRDDDEDDEDDDENDDNGRDDDERDDDSDDDEDDENGGSRGDDESDDDED